MSIAVGIIDGGFGPVSEREPRAAAEFVSAEDGSVVCSPPAANPLPHGECVAALVRDAAPTVRLIDARVATPASRPTARIVAAAIDWCAAEGARVINLSLGLVDDRRVLREACDRALGQGLVVVAAAPVRGAPVFPAAYPGVLSVSGDARCTSRQWSLLNGETAGGALYGCCPAGPNDGPGGASMAAARFAGIVAQLLARFPFAGRDGLAEYLAARASWCGREHRRIAEIDS